MQSVDNDDGSAPAAAGALFWSSRQSNANCRRVVRVTHCARLGHPPRSPPSTGPAVDQLRLDSGFQYPALTSRRTRAERHRRRAIADRQKMDLKH